MNEILNDFFEMLVEHNKQYGNFQPMSIFNSAKQSFREYESLLLDFFHYLTTHNIIRPGLDFNNAEMPFMTFTKYGKTLVENKGRKIALFEEFLNLYNSE